MTEWQALLLSIAIEAPIVAVVAGRYRLAPPLHAAGAIALATAVTHPQLWMLALWAYPRLGYWPSILVLEAVVALVEAAVLAFVLRLQAGPALLLSVMANGISFLAGLVLIG
ncbi:MAG: hypothetical protein PHS60_08190 [Zavarzinia sp.]|nr:hypothetical protein [Zavarzinia sp.]